MLCCRGIGEPLTGNMLSHVTDHLPVSRYEVVEVPWAASYGPVPRIDGQAYKKSLNEGMLLLDRMVRDAVEADQGVILLGYSGGAALAHRYTSVNPYLVDGLGLIADPYREPGAGVPEHTAPGFGLGGTGYPLTVGPAKVFEIADPADMICSCPANSPLRTFADQTYAVSFRDPIHWAGDLLDRLAKNRWQSVRINWLNPFETLRLYSEAAWYADGYLRRGDHTGYPFRTMPGTDRTYTQVLIDLLMDEFGA